jgi:hypothetical protein
MSTTPESTTSCVLPSGCTSTSQSVPRMPSVAVGVVRRTRPPTGGRARLQMRPVMRRSTETTVLLEGSASASIWNRLFGCRRNWLRSGMSKAIWLSASVRKVVPGGIFCETATACQGACS